MEQIAGLESMIGWVRRTCGDEIKAAGLPEAPTNKPALFIDRLVMRKQSPQKTDEVRVSLRAVGFVFQK